MLNVKGIHFNFVTSVDEFRRRTEKLKEEALAAYDSLATEHCLTFPKIGQKLADFELKFTTESNILKLYHLVHTDKSFRDESTAADKILSDLQIELR